MTTLVSKDMMIKDVSIQIQDKIKEAVNKTADLEVKQVNVKVKNIATVSVITFTSITSNIIKIKAIDMTLIISENKIKAIFSKNFIFSPPFILRNDRFKSA